MDLSVRIGRMMSFETMILVWITEHEGNRY